MIVVDTSVWIDFFRNTPSSKVDTLEHIISEDEIIVGDLVLLEVLQGARDERHARHLEQELRQFEYRTFLTDGVATQAASIFRQLRAEGITIRKTVDLVIATFCIREGHALLQNDRDFQPIAERFGLRLL